MTVTSGLVDDEQVASALRAQIQDGTIASGQAVMSATALADQAGAPRLACARALQRLALEGLLTRYPGLGYYVTARRAAAGSCP